MGIKEKILSKHGYTETWQSKGLKNAMDEYAKFISIDFKQFCDEKQISYVRNGFQDLSTEDMFEQYKNQK